MPARLEVGLAPRIRVDRVFADRDRRSALHDETFWSLRESPKQLSPKWLYDERGSLLFDRITKLPEYYPFRRERAVIGARAAEIATLTDAETLVELGSGTSEKTRLLLDALVRHGTLRCFAPLDVSEEILRSSATAIAGRYPSLQVHAVVGDFERHLRAVPTGPRRLVAFLGSTIGNLLPDQRRVFLARVGSLLEEDDALLLGVDLVKRAERLHAAYNDTAGVTERFVRNGLLAVDRELGSHLAAHPFAYTAAWDPERSWVEIGLRSRRAARLPLPALEVELALDEGELLRMEVSTKFTRDGITRELAAAGLELDRWWTDPDGDFALCLTAPTR
jgi:L-histidine N-alpha-methyltransferase